MEGLQPLSLTAGTPEGFSNEQVRQALMQAFQGLKGRLRKVLLVPPDFTRFHSQAGLITKMLYDWLSPDCRVDILPALGTHVPVSQADWELMYAGIPLETMLTHHWRNEVRLIGEIPGSFVSAVSGGLMDQAIPVEINRHLLDPSYDLILSIGQVVPHEVAGMANQAKNIFVGCGGTRMINTSHMVGAICGMESFMGQDESPVRALLDYAAEHFLSRLPLCYVLTVTTAIHNSVTLHGLFIGNERKVFEDAVTLSQQKNIVHLDRPIKKCVVNLDENEFHATWICNKAIYRTRMAIKDGGELIVLAPGVKRFGEDATIDGLIRKYGYCGRDKLLLRVREEDDLRQNLSAAAHIIHGSSEGRFKITYCTRHLTREEIEGVGYCYLPYEEALKKYTGLQQGWNQTGNGEEIYYIQNPALGLWMAKDRS